MQKNNKKNNNWITPEYFYEPLHAEFKFDFDPCPIEYGEITPDKDGLLKEWGNCNWVNPPYSVPEKTAFIMKAIEEMKKGKCSVVLVPVSTSTKLFHDIILPNITEPIRFVKRRLKFKGYNKDGKFLTKAPAMHDSMVLIFDGRRKN